MEGIVILSPFEFHCLRVNKILVQHPNLITLKNNACSKINLFGEKCYFSGKDIISRIILRRLIYPPLCNPCIPRN